MIKFSVIVPIYMVEKYLPQCVESVLNQSYDNFELILVDDGSKDGCADLCDKYAERDCRVKVIHKTNGGTPAARNSGIKVATGDYLMYLDGDDFWDLDYLRNVAPLIENNRKDVYLGNSRFDYQKDITIKVELFRVDDIINKNYEGILKTFFNGKNCMPAASWHNIYSTKFIRDNSLYFDETLTWSEDADNSYRVLFSTKEIGFFDYTHYYYRRDNIGAMTKNPSLKHFLSNMTVSKRWFNYIKDSSLSIEVKNIIMRNFANSYMYLLKPMICLNDEDYKIATDKIIKEKEMLKHVGGFPCIFVYRLSTIIGFRNISKLLRVW